ncbi:MAG: HD domain-containing protein [Rhizobiales bacterium]|nr:HD domain-containing protein [Hyphomicrobiales bacterium]
MQPAFSRFETFAPQEALARALLPHATEANGDGSHDVAHLLRVWKNAAAIQREEGGDPSILLAATLLHDCVSVEKNSPLRAEASRLAAEKAASILAGLGWAAGPIAAVGRAIAAHSFSAGIEPVTIEAKTLQDADRLDAIGMVGVARCFYIAGRMGSALYDADDPQAAGRPYDDKRFAIDHFHTKLLKLSAGFRTAAGGRMAQERHARLERFLAEFSDEI